MILIYDVNGYIAGMHSVVSKRFTSDDDPFSFDSSIWYRADVLLNNDQVYLTTAYFVDPGLICGSGRSQEQFEVEGTGNRLVFQNGPAIADLLSAPMDLDAADKDPIWFKHFCFLNMGRHYFNLNYDENQPCDELIPIQLIYSGGVLNGFVWQHPSPLEGERWEVVSAFGLNQIVDRPPACLLQLVDTPGVRTMHTYLRNYGTLCIDDKTQ